MILSKRTDFVFTTAQPGTVLVGGNNPHRNVSIDKGYFEKNTENGKHRATVNGTHCNCCGRPGCDTCS